MFFSVMNQKLTTKEFAEQVGLTYGRIHQFIKSGEIEAERIGRDYVIDAKYVAVIKNRPERRGRPRKSSQVSAKIV